MCIIFFNFFVYFLFFHIAKYFYRFFCGWGGGGDCSLDANNDIKNANFKKFRILICIYMKRLGELFENTKSFLKYRWHMNSNKIIKLNWIFIFEGKSPWSVSAIRKRNFVLCMQWLKYTKREDKELKQTRKLYV